MQLTLNWEYVADTVMGGVSVGTMTTERFHGREAAVLRGDVSLENNGGFIQIATDLRPSGQALDASQWHGIEIDVWGNGQTYDVRLRTDQLQRPWQSFRTEIQTTGDWQTIRLTFDEFVPHKIETPIDLTSLRRIGLLAIGSEFQAEIAVSGLRFFD